MSRFIEGQDRQQVALIPECLDDFIADDNPVRIIDAFVDELNLACSDLRRQRQQLPAARRITRPCC